MPKVSLSPETTLPVDGYAGALAGRAWLPAVAGPAVVAIREDGVYDLSATFATMRDLCEGPNPAASLRGAPGERIGMLAELLANAKGSDTSKPSLLAPI